ncbi:MAG: ribosome-associated translation inhibitor RaiA [Bacillota bacterium]|jgi:putative sigma-54 modulation protein
MLIRGDNVCVTEALRNVIHKKMSRLEKHTSFSLENTVVVLNVTKAVHRIEVTIKCAAALIRAEEASDDMYAAIDLVIEKLDKQFRRYKCRVNRRVRHEANPRTIQCECEGASATATMTKLEEIDVEVERVKRFALKPMFLEEAILQMEMLGHNFFVFKMPDDDDQAKIIYKRKDGRIGLIEPQ